MDLKTWMDANGFVDDKLAEQVGVTRSYITRVRNGVVHPSLGLGLQIRAATGDAVELEWLLPRHMRPKPAAPKPAPKKVATPLKDAVNKAVKAKPQPKALAAKPGKPQTPAAPKVYRARATA